MVLLAVGASVPLTGLTMRDYLLAFVVAAQIHIIYEMAKAIWDGRGK